MEETWKKNVELERNGEGTERERIDRFQHKAVIGIVTT